MLSLFSDTVSFFTEGVGAGGATHGASVGGEHLERGGAEGDRKLVIGAVWDYDKPLNSPHLVISVSY